MRAIADRVDLRIAPTAQLLIDEDAGRHGQPGKVREFCARADAAGEQEQVAADLLAVRTHERVKAFDPVGVEPHDQALRSRMVHHRDSGPAGTAGKNRAAAPVKIARHGNFVVVNHARFASRPRGRERDLHAENSRAEHNDSLSGSHGGEHRVAIRQVTEHGHPAGKLRPSGIGSSRIRRGHHPVPPHSHDAVKGWHVSSGARRQHEPIVGQLLEGARPFRPEGHRPPGAVDRGDACAGDNANARGPSLVRIGHFETVPIGLSHGVLGDQHPVVGVRALRADDGE